MKAAPNTNKGFEPKKVSAPSSFGNGIMFDNAKAVLITIKFVVIAVAGNIFNIKANNIAVKGPVKAIFAVSKSVKCVYFLPNLYIGFIEINERPTAANFNWPEERITINIGSIKPRYKLSMPNGSLLNSLLFENPYLLIFQTRCSVVHPDLEAINF